MIDMIKLIIGIVLIVIAISLITWRCIKKFFKGELSTSFIFNLFDLAILVVSIAAIVCGVVLIRGGIVG